MASAENAKPTWRHLKAELDRFDRAGLLGRSKICTERAGTTKCFSVRGLVSAQIRWNPTGRQSLAGFAQTS